MKYTPDDLTKYDILAILEDSDYTGISVDTVEFSGTGDDQYAAIYTCTAEDDSGIDEILTFKIFLTCKPNGELEAEF
jgi:hypothetical protein